MKFTSNVALFVALVASFSRTTTAQSLFTASDMYYSSPTQVIVSTYLELDYVTQTYYTANLQNYVYINGVSQGFFEYNGTQAVSSMLVFTVPPGAVSNFEYTLARVKPKFTCGSGYCDYMNFSASPIQAYQFSASYTSAYWGYYVGGSTIPVVWTTMSLAPSLSNELTSLQTCLDTQYSCQLAPGTYHFGPGTGNRNQPLLITRPGVILNGSDSVLLRDPGYHGVMLRVDLSSSGSPSTVERLTFRNNGHLTCFPTQDIIIPVCLSGASDIQVIKADTGNVDTNQNGAADVIAINFYKIKMINSVQKGLQLYAFSKINGVRIRDCEFVSDKNDPLLPQLLALSESQCPGGSQCYTNAPHNFPSGPIYEANGAPALVRQYPRYFGGKLLSLSFNGDWGNTNACNYQGFANDNTITFPRNIRIEFSRFLNTNQGSVAGMARWWYMINNQFINDDMAPEADGSGDQGGIVFVESCSDQVQFKRNVIIGSNVTFDTSGLEIQGKNMTIEGNDISNVAKQGIGANNTENLFVYSNNVHNNSRGAIVPGIQIGSYNTSVVTRGTINPTVSFNTSGNINAYLQIVPLGLQIARPASQAVGFEVGRGGADTRSGEIIQYCAYENGLTPNNVSPSCYNPALLTPPQQTCPASPTQPHNQVTSPCPPSVVQ